MFQNKTQFNLNSTKTNFLKKGCGVGFVLKQKKRAIAILCPMNDKNGGNCAVLNLCLFSAFFIISQEL